MLGFYHIRKKKVSENTFETVTSLVWRFFFVFCFFAVVVSLFFEFFATQTGLLSLILLSFLFSNNLNLFQVLL